jgi:hypothetical protein
VNCHELLREEYQQTTAEALSAGGNPEQVLRKDLHAANLFENIE